MLSLLKAICKKIIFYPAVLTPLFLLVGNPRLCMSAEECIIRVPTIHVRSSPSQIAPSLGTLSKDTRVEITGYEGGYVKILFRGKTGYIRNRDRYIQIISSTGKKETQDNLTPKHTSTQKIKEMKQEVEAIGKKIETHETEVKTFSQEEAKIISHLDGIEASLNKASRKVSTLKEESSTVEKEIEKITSDISDLSKEVKEAEKYAAERLVALYKLNMMGKADFLISAESMNDLFYRKTALEKILECDSRTLDDLSKKEEKLHASMEKLNQKKEEKLGLEKELKEQIRIMSEEKIKRTKLLAEIREKKSLELAAIDFLKQAADALNQTIATMNVDSDVPKKTSKDSFLDYKGLLKMPVQGKIIKFFGSFRNSEFNVTNFRSGIEIAAEKGEPIHCVWDGKILFADWFKGYGNLIIVDHGDSYYTVYAHADELLKSKGDTVKAADVIATVGDSGSMKGSTLYFEIRHRGKAVDPLEWLNKG